MTCIVFGSSMGNTEKAATLIADKLKTETRLVNVAELTAGSFDGCEMILLGSSTWGVGDLQDDWESKIDLLKDVDLSGRKVGFFGCGDQEMYADSFADAIGILYETVKDSAGELVGSWPVDGYTFSESRAVVDGSFVGLPLDEDNQPELTELRVSEWAAGLK